MKLVIGLGNPGGKYDGTRHNVGFEILDKIQKTWDFPEFNFEGKFKAKISKERDIILVKPVTFMNLSGEAVGSLMDFYKLEPADIIVIHDDIDIKIGEHKIATDSRSAGHNGVQNIIDNLGTKEFKRIRIGVGEEKDGVLVCRIDAHDFVLQRFSEEELKKIQEIEEKIIAEVKENI